MTRPAVFLDRDGVLTEPILNPKTGDYEPAKTEKDLRLCAGAIRSLKRIQDSGFLLFLVSNQPDYAKGKATLSGLKGVQKRFDQILRKAGIRFTAYYYCYHHPNGIVKGYSYKCKCRKPKPYFILKAAKAYKTDLKNSWMIGDRDSDIECGAAAGTKTILVKEKSSAKKRGGSKPDYTAKDVVEATYIILGVKS